MNAKEVETCVICGSMPREWTEFREGVVQQVNLIYHREMRGENEVIVDDNGTVVPNNAMRRKVYQIFTYLKYSHLRRGNCMRIPSCATTRIRELYADEECMGFREE